MNAACCGCKSNWPTSSCSSSMNWASCRSPRPGAELLFELISQRYERGATLITSNLPFDEWTQTFGTERLTGALLDRLTHHVNILEMNARAIAWRKAARASPPTPPDPADTDLALTGQSGQSTASYLGSAADWPPPRGTRDAQTQSGLLLRRPVAGFYSAVDIASVRASRQWLRCACRSLYVCANSIKARAP